MFYLIKNTVPVKKLIKNSLYWSSLMES